MCNIILTQKIRPDADTLYSCAACRGRKARCVPRPPGDCERCETNGLTCVFEDIQEPWKSSSRFSRSSLSHDMPSRSQGQETPSSRAEAEVRVLGDFAGSPVESFYSNATTRSNPQTLDDVESIQQYKNGRVLPQDTPASSELEGAILLVEEAGRTRRYTFCHEIAHLEARCWN